MADLLAHLQAFLQKKEAVVLLAGLVCGITIRSFLSKSSDLHIEPASFDIPLARVLSQLEYSPDSVLTAAEATEVFKKLRMRASASTLRELFRAVRTVSGKGSENLLRFGELLLCAKHSWKRNAERVGLRRERETASPCLVSPSTPRRQPRERELQATRAASSPSPRGDPRQKPSHQVFLGGACNPTTWRKSIVIPVLASHKITYYNPQVDDWSPDLIELEDRAKATAELLFFVIDNETRGVASMIEVAYLAASGRPIVVVMRDFDERSLIDGTPLSKREIDDLNRGHDFLSHLLQVDNVLIFNEIEDALEFTMQLFSGADTSNSDAALHSISPGFDWLSLLGEVNAVFRQYDRNDDGLLTISEAMLCVRALAGLTMPFESVQSSLNLPASTQEDDPVINFQAFCFFLAQLNIEIEINQESEGLARDVFLGGSCGFHHADADWRARVCIPELQKAGISFFNPNVETWTPRLISLEVSRPNTHPASFRLNRGLTAPFIVAHGKAILHCTAVRGRQQHSRGRLDGGGCTLYRQKAQHGPLCSTAPGRHEDRGSNPGCQGSEGLPSPVSSAATPERFMPHCWPSSQDFNRGRAYLTDLANRNRISVFTDIPPAVSRAVTLIEGERERRTMHSPVALATSSP
eukprot:m.321140 g.321140  ORF g.321140 m.321140 type:complete len:638 (+) comp55512_c0_seq13:1214-3127(+)